MNKEEFPPTGCEPIATFPVLDSTSVSFQEEDCGECIITSSSRTPAERSSILVVTTSTANTAMPEIVPAISMGSDSESDFEVDSQHVAYSSTPNATPSKSNHSQPKKVFTQSPSSDNPVHTESNSAYTPPYSHSKLSNSTSLSKPTTTITSSAIKRKQDELLPTLVMSKNKSKNKKPKKVNDIDDIFGDL